MLANEMIVRLLMDSNKLAATQLSITIAVAGDYIDSKLQKIALEAVEQTSDTLEEVKEAAGYE